MQKQAYIFIGQSGAGKGTQAALFEQKVRTVHPAAGILHLETGAIFRSFIQSDSYTAHETKALIARGELPPSFIGVHVWSHELIAQYSGQDFVFLDGTPRVIDEAPVLLSAAHFYGWKVNVVYIEVSDAWANERLIGRGRHDDTDETERMGRLAWFHENVMPAVEYLKAAPGVNFLTINGEREIEVIQQDICTQLEISSLDSTTAVA